MVFPMEASLPSSNWQNCLVHILLQAKWKGRQAFILASLASEGGRLEGLSDEI